MTLPWTVGNLLSPGNSGLFTLLGGFNNNAEGSHFINGVDRACVSFDGTSEYLANSASNTLGIGNAWTISMWIRPNSMFKNGTLIDIGSLENASEIRIEQQLSNIIVTLSNAAGTTFKDWTFLGVLDQQGVWMLVTVTWDGTDIEVYTNGLILNASPTKFTDDTDSQGTDDRSIFVGARSSGSNYFDGRIHSILVWDVALGQNAVKTVYNHGSGSYFNPERNQDDYASAGDLVHWWRLGFDPSDLGADSIAAFAVDLNANSANIASADLERFSPDGSYVRFNGTDELLRKGTGNSGGGVNTVNLGIANTFTISLWLSLDDTTAGTIFECNSGDSDLGRDEDDKIALEVSSTKFDFICADASGGTVKTITSSENVRAVSAEGNNRWYNVVLRKNGTSEVAMFVNGLSDVTSSTGIPTTTDASRIVAFGASPITPDNYWAGRIHSCMVWDTALSAAEISQMYNQGFKELDPRRTNGSYVSSNSLKHWWRMGAPVGSVGAGGDYVNDQVSTSPIDLTADDSGLTSASNRATVADLGQGRSLEFDGTNDYLSRTSSLTDLGFGNNFTFAVWLRHFTAGGLMRMLDTLGPSSALNSRVTFRIRGNQASDRFNIAMRDATTTTLLKNYDFTGVAADEDWYHFVGTWNGTTEALRGYRNGEEDTSPIKVDDDSIALDQRDRELWIGRNADTGAEEYEGVLGYVAMWSSVLSDDEIKEISLHGLEFDLRQPGQVYNSESDLVMYYAFGVNPDTDLGDDLGSSGTGLTPTSLDETDSFGDNPRVI